jgi:Flp pilus assembly protein TadG
MDPQHEASNPVPERRTSRGHGCLRQRSAHGGTTGQAIVEFLIVSGAFFMMVFGTIDFGRAIYMYSELHSSVQEGARIGQTDPGDHVAIRAKVIDAAESFDLSADDVTVTCYTSDETVTDLCAGSSKVQVAATAEFTAITQDFLGIKPVTMTATSRVATE